MIDRPLSSKHPKWYFAYPVNYGRAKNIIEDDRASGKIFLKRDYQIDKDRLGWSFFGFSGYNQRINITNYKSTRIINQ